MHDSKQLDLEQQNSSSSSNLALALAAAAVWMFVVPGIWELSGKTFVLQEITGEKQRYPVKENGEE